MAAWWIIAAAVALSVAVSILLRPKVKAPKPDSVKDLEDPTADAGRPIPVVFGTVTVKGLNVLWFGEKSKVTKKFST
jgi:hypothetical protein